MAKLKLAKLSVEVLKQEIARRQAALPDLIAQRDALNLQITELEGLGAVKPSAKLPKKAGRRKVAQRATRRDKGVSRRGTLAIALIEAFGAKSELTIPEAIEAVLAAGYRTNAKNFPSMVSDLLAKDKRFRRVRRGIYALEPTAIAQEQVNMSKAARVVVKPARSGSLSSALAEALKNNGKLTVAQAAAAVQMAGYKSKSKDFQNIVGMTLSKDKQFKRVGRGVYKLKG